MAVVGSRLEFFENSVTRHQVPAFGVKLAWDDESSDVEIDLPFCSSVFPNRNQFPSLVLGISSRICGIGNMKRALRRGPVQIRSNSTAPNQEALYRCLPS